MLENMTVIDITMTQIGGNMLKIKGNLGVRITKTKPLKEAKSGLNVIQKNGLPTLLWGMR
jgi:hypothetical protein